MNRDSSQQQDPHKLTGNNKKNTSKPMNFIQYTVDDSGILKQERRKRRNTSKTARKNNSNTITSTSRSSSNMVNDNSNVNNDIIPIIHNRYNNDQNSNNIATSVGTEVNYSDQTSHIPSISLNTPPQRSPTSSNDGNSSSSSCKRKRSQVKRSCIHCRRAHAKCDETVSETILVFQLLLLLLLLTIVHL